MKEYLTLRLQLFADAAAGEGGDGGADTGAEGTVDAGQDEAAVRAEGYQKFKTDYKAEFDDEVSKIVQGRLRKQGRENKALNDRISGLNPLIEEISKRYNVDIEDTEGLLNAVRNDRAYIRQQALEQDKSEEEFLYDRDREFRLRALEAEKSAREEAERREAANRFWDEGAQETQKYYPDFDFNEEFEANEGFRKYLSHGIDVRSAYELAHRDEIHEQLIRVGVQKGQEKTAAAVAANNARPSENGVSAGAAVSQKIDIASLTNEQLDEYLARARRGERIDFINNF